VTAPRHGIGTRITRRYPGLLATTGSCARPRSSPNLGVTLVSCVFAGSCAPLPDLALSRRYLCESFSTCLDLYPACSRGARTHYFPPDDGLPGVSNRSALRKRSRQQLLSSGVSRGYSHSFIFRPADLLATPVAPTAALPRQAAVAFTSPHISVRYLPEQGIC